MKDSLVAVAVSCALCAWLALSKCAAQVAKPDGQMEFDTVNTMAETFNRGMAPFEKRARRPGT